MKNPAACAHGATVFVWCSATAAATGGDRGQTAAEENWDSMLFGITVSDGVGIVTQFETRGAIPSVQFGLSMHISDDYCYLLGTSGSAVHRMLLPPSSGLSSATGRLMFLSPGRSNSIARINSRASGTVSPSPSNTF
eukprot:CAMPEP_0176423996 /NCGR_PEP_ID=MMETSP0127-20121128/10597_1 /TAXON_ID=938130 /ORGANISM="Platyophrya macrostoma, Strain WH" /LENGTH=136 /DNA_ID=CAMNT_0017805015 /DNA_START=222 /DNA_END=632 /DNA_ORIENTATION=-